MQRNLNDISSSMASRKPWSQLKETEGNGFVARHSQPNAESKSADDVELGAVEGHGDQLGVYPGHGSEAEHDHARSRKYTCCADPPTLNHGSSNHEKSVAWFELLFDLLLVAAIAQIAVREANA